MPLRLAMLTSCAVLVPALIVGCAGARHGGTASISARSLAPDDAGRHPNPNAPYILAGGSPRLIQRATEGEARNAVPCEPAALSVDEIAGEVRGNSRSVKLAFMNRGAVPCTVGGYPVVRLLDANDASIGTILTEKITAGEVVAGLSQSQGAAPDANAPTVVLMPHQVAAFQLVWTTGDNCAKVAKIAVQAPGSSQIFGIPQPMNICAGRIQITALRLDEGDV